MTQKSPPLFASKVLYLNIFSFAYEKRFWSKRTHVYLQKIHKNNFNQTYGFNLWRSIPDITRCAVLTYANKAAKSKMEAASFLGISMYEYYLYLKRYLNVEQPNIFKPKKWKR